MYQSIYICRFSPLETAPAAGRPAATWHSISTNSAQPDYGYTYHLPVHCAVVVDILIYIIICTLVKIHRQHWHMRLAVPAKKATDLFCLYTVFQKNRTPETFYYNFAKIALISLKIGTHNLHMT